MLKTSYDFSGYATKANVKCTDGRVITKDAFKDNDGTTVPVVWQHLHNDPSNVLGHALLEHRDDGVYSYVTLNKTQSGENARLLVEHGDITSLSIYANNLVEKAPSVIHGVIREVSLVLAGANPGAVIDNIVISHADGSVASLEDEAVIFSGETLVLKEKHPVEEPVVRHEEAASDGETVGEVFETLSEKQKTAVYAIIASLVDEGDLEQGDSNEEVLTHNDEGEKNIMKANVFDGNASNDKKVTLSHAQFSAIVQDAQKTGSFKEALLKHAGTYGIDNIDYLFPDAQTVGDVSFIKPDMDWVSGVINGTRHSPFARIKTIHADITVETARALGYVTGNLKKEEVFGLLRRITTPTTIYKKQKLDRDDIVDITDMDVVAWLKREMRWMLDMELARAVLIGDGRDPVAEVDDKIVETCIRPIWTDDAMYSHKVPVALLATTEDVIDAIVGARTNYKGSGNPTLFITPSDLTDMLLLKDADGYRMYKTEAELAAALRVKNIVEVPVMESQVREAGATDYTLIGIIVNLSDYTMGADKGGQVSMFDDFDIDYNQYKYLIETRCSGALTLPKSALVIERATA